MEVLGKSEKSERGVWILWITTARDYQYSYRFSGLIHISTVLILIISLYKFFKN